jgi:hypothetical protein
MRRKSAMRRWARPELRSIKYVKEWMNNMVQHERVLPEYRSGISPISILAVLYAIFIFVPAMMYQMLMTGTSGGVPVAWFTLIVFVEIGRLCGVSISKQEATMIYLLAGSEMFIPLSLVYAGWFRTSDIVALLGFGPEIPDWYAPPPETHAMSLRSFFYPFWIQPLAVTLSFAFLSPLLSWGLGSLAREIYVEIENLPFPIQQMGAEAIITLTSREEEPTRFLAVFGLIGFAYGFVLYALPFIMQAWTGRVMQIIPIPWIDLMQSLETAIPGAMFGIPTDLVTYTSGLVLGLPTASAIFIGSFSIYFIGGLLTSGSWWFPGMGMAQALQRSIFYFWAAPLIGLGLSAGLVPILTRPRLVVRALTQVVTASRAKVRLRRTDPLPRAFIMFALIVGLVGGVIYYIMLAPAFLATAPWMLLLIVSLPVVATLIEGRMVGETGVSFVPSDYMRNLMYMFSGYRGVDVWFCPSIATLAGRGPIIWYKVAELTKTKATSLIKLWWIMWPIAVLVGFLYVEIFWRLAPIPSARYPGVQIFWPIDATYTSLWIKGVERGVFEPLWILYSFLIGTAIYFATSFLRLPVPYTALVAGAAMAMPYGFGTLVGGLLNKLLEMRLGKEWIARRKFLIAAGLLIGQGIAISISVSIAIIINSIWILPF